MNSICTIMILGAVISISSGLNPNTDIRRPIGGRSPPSNGITIVSRQEWGARAPREIVLMNTPVSFVFIHHTATPMPDTNFESNAAAVRQIQDYHMDINGFVDIGYSFMVGTDGSLFEARGWNRQGAHTSRRNDIGIGVALLGTFSSVLPSDKQMNAAKALIQFGIKNGWVDSKYSLYGHRDAVVTDCPGTKFYNHIKTWERFHQSPLPPL